LTNRRLAECKLSIGQVLISRTRTDCGEVAERLKAAVCQTPFSPSAAFVSWPKFLSFQHFHDRPHWPALSLEAHLWRAAGTIAGTVSLRNQIQSDNMGR
jgi:hypothetical protein